jgi:hypothetical protein
VLTLRATSLLVCLAVMLGLFALGVAGMVIQWATHQQIAPPQSPFARLRTEIEGDLEHDSLLEDERNARVIYDQMQMHTRRTVGEQLGGRVACPD